MGREEQWRSGFHITANGETLRLKDMTTQHLKNAIAYFTELDVSPFEKELSRRAGGKRIILYPYKIYSGSCRDIVAALKNHGRKSFGVYPDRNYIPRSDDVIVNWGNTQEPRWGYADMLNRPQAVANAVNKLATFQLLQKAEVRAVPFTTDINVARAWGGLVVERHKLRAHSGAGIKIAEADEITKAPLYTQLLAPCEEYRVHIFRGEVIDYSKKCKRTEDGLLFSNDELIKNKSNGWEFLREVDQREGVVTRAKTAVEALGLDFGSVDVIRYKDKSYVLEVGTAAGLSPRGVELFASAIMEYADR